MKRFKYRSSSRYQAGTKASPRIFVQIACGNHGYREEQISKLESGHQFDVLVIGGGATGTGVALDAASRGIKQINKACFLCSLAGLSVALVERDDFSSGTSSRSTKLIHGGVRYLQKAVLKFDRQQVIVPYNIIGRLYL